MAVLGPRTTGPALVVLGTVARAGAQWVLVWLVARASGAAAVGEYSFALAVATPVFLLSQLSLRNVYLTLTGRPPFAVFLRLRLVGSALAVAAVLALAASPVALTMAATLPVVAYKLADSLLDLYLARLQERGDLGRAGIALLLGATVSVAAAVAAFALTGDALAAIWAAALGPAAALALVLPMTAGPDATRRSRGTERAARRLLRSAAPLGAAEVLTALLSYLPVLMLGLVASSVTVGLFTAAMSFVTLAFLLLSGVQTAVVARFAADFRGGGAPAVVTAGVRLAAALSAVAVPAAALVLAAGPQVLAWLYGPEFAVPAGHLWPVAATVAVAPCLTVCGLVLTALNTYGWQLWGGLAAVITMTLLAAALAVTGDVGIHEAGLVLLVGCVVRILTSWLVVRRAAGPRRGVV